MDTSKYKLSGMEALQDSLKDAVGTPIGPSTVQSIKSTSERTLQGLVDVGTLSSFDVGKVQTKHQSKGLWGKVGDYFLWKTPLRRWYYKPFYVQVDLADKLTMLREHSCVLDDLEDEDFNELVQGLRGIQVWEERYPEDPYSIVLADISVQPVIPLDNISFTVTL